MPNRPLILIVDDERSVRQAVRMSLQGDYEVMDAASVDEAKVLLTEHEFDLVLLDICIGRQSGIDILRFLNTSGLSRPVVCVSGEASYGQAIDAYKLGAVDVLDKPLTQQKLLFTIKKCLLQHRSAERQQAFLGSLPQREPQLLGSSPLIRELRAQTSLIATTESRVLIQGETGTGKEAVAAAIHRNSKRAAGPFVVVDCGSLPASLIDSVLFGHKKGAFTGANHDQVGRLECADHGTLFLDELGELSLDGQNRLLRFIETGELQRLGSTKLTKIDVRIIAATSRNLEQLMTHGSFRSDLYYRLNVFSLRTPPLRDIVEDIPDICRYHLDKFCRELGRPPLPLETSQAAILQRHNWPGNVRELRNFAERAALLGLPQALASLPCQASADLPPSVHAGHSLTLQPLREFRKALERDYIAKVLEHTAGNVTRAAKILEIDRVSLHQKIVLYQLR